jgi:hypothetical protein
MKNNSSNIWMTALVSGLLAGGTVVAHDAPAKSPEAKKSAAGKKKCADCSKAKCDCKHGKKGGDGCSKDACDKDACKGKEHKAEEHKTEEKK